MRDYMHASMIHKASTYIHAVSNFFVVGSIESRSFAGHQALWLSVNGVVVGHQALWFFVFDGLFLLAVCTCVVYSPITCGNGRGLIFRSRLNEL